MRLSLVPMCVVSLWTLCNCHKSHRRVTMTFNDWGHFAYYTIIWYHEIRNGCFTKVILSRQITQKSTNLLMCPTGSIINSMSNIPTNCFYGHIMAWNKVLSIIISYVTLWGVCFKLISNISWMCYVCHTYARQACLRNALTHLFTQYLWLWPNVEYVMTLEKN